MRTNLRAWFLCPEDGEEQLVGDQAGQTDRHGLHSPAASSSLLVLQSGGCSPAVAAHLPLALGSSLSVRCSLKLHLPS